MGFDKHSEHLNAHFLNKKYSTGIYKGFNGKWSELSPKEKETALKKRWYVRWSYRNPSSGKMERQENVYKGVNEYKTHGERMRILKEMEKELITLLQSGLNPYNSDHQGPLSVFEAIDHALSIKKNHMKHSSFIRFISDINKFKAFLKRNGYERRSILSVDKKTVTNYLNEVLNDVSARSRNNYKTNIGSVWQTLKDEGIVKENFVSSIPLLKSKPKRNRTYTDAQVNKLFGYMDKNCPNLLLFVKFVSYNFLRPIEVCRLNADSFDWESQTLTVRTKSEEMKIKTIPSILMDEIPKVGSGFLFTKNGFWGEWDISEEAKRGHFSREFRKVKDAFGLGEDFGIYSFRHYFISKLYKSMRKEYSPFEVKSKLMLITGHSSMSALEKYLRSIDAEKPEDYSEGLV